MPALCRKREGVALDELDAALGEREAEAAVGIDTRAAGGDERSKRAVDRAVNVPRLIGAAVLATDERERRGADNRDLNHVADLVHLGPCSGTDFERDAIAHFQMLGAFDVELKREFMGRRDRRAHFATRKIRDVVERGHVCAAATAFNHPILIFVNFILPATVVAYEAGIRLSRRERRDAGGREDSVTRRIEAVDRDVKEHRRLKRRQRRGGHRDTDRSEQARTIGGGDRLDTAGHGRADGVGAARDQTRQAGNQVRDCQIGHGYRGAGRVRRGASRVDQRRPRVDRWDTGRGFEYFAGRDITPIADGDRLTRDVGAGGV